MMYKSKYNYSTGDVNNLRTFEKGKLYSAEEVEGCDMSNFELDESNVVEAPQTPAGADTDKVEIETEKKADESLQDGTEKQEVESTTTGPQTPAGAEVLE